MKGAKAITVVGLVLMFLGCKNDDPKPKEPFFPYTFALKLYNEAGKESTSFTQGEDILFSFELTNVTDSVQNMTPFPCKLAATDDYFMVYRKTESNKWTQVGKACLEQGCPLVNDYGQEAHTTRKFQNPWLHIPNLPCSNEPLAVGSYKTGFQYEFEILDGEYKGLKSKQTFLVEFEVK